MVVPDERAERREERLGRPVPAGKFALVEHLEHVLGFELIEPLRRVGPVAGRGGRVVARLVAFNLGLVAARAWSSVSAAPPNEIVYIFRGEAAGPWLASTIGDVSVPRPPPALVDFVSAWDYSLAEMPALSAALGASMFMMLSFRINRATSPPPPPPR